MSSRLVGYAVVSSDGHVAATWWCRGFDRAGGTPADARAAAFRRAEHERLHDMSCTVHPLLLGAAEIAEDAA